MDLPFLENVRTAFATVANGGQFALLQRLALSPAGAIALGGQVAFGSRLVFLNADGTLAGHTQIAQGFVGAIAPLQNERFLFGFSHPNPQRLAIYTAAGLPEPQPIAALAPISHDGAQFTLKIHSLITGQLNLQHTADFETWSSTQVTVTPGEQTLTLPTANPQTYYQVAPPTN